MNEDVAWIRMPLLWQAAQKQAAEDAPFGSKAYWRRVREIYDQGGGRYEDGATEPEGEECS